MYIFILSFNYIKKFFKIQLMIYFFTVYLIFLYLVSLYILNQKLINNNLFEHQIFIIDPFHL